MAKSAENPRYYESPARRAYWMLHVQAWIKSGVARTRYCNDLGLCRRAFKRWLVALDTPVPKRRKPDKKQNKRTLARVPAMGTQASRAFWLMHAEAQRGSGLNATEYALRHRLLVRRMRREARKFRNAPQVDDWRDLMHPDVRNGVRPPAQLRQELRQVGPRPNRSSDSGPVAPPVQGRRRQFSDAQKLAILAEAAEPGIIDSTVARRHGVTPSMISRWRTEFGMGTREEAVLMTAHVIDTPARGRRKQPLVLQQLLPQPPGMMTVQLPDGRTVYAPEGSDPDAVRAHVAQQEVSP